MMIRLQQEMVESIDPEKARRLRPAMERHLEACSGNCLECDISRIQLKRIAEAERTGVWSQPV